MKTSFQGIAFIKAHEGYRPQVYSDAAGLPTIGYGHLIRRGEEFPQEGIDKNAAEELLKQDILQAEHSLLRLVTRPLSQPQFDALVSFIFNLGGAAFQRSTLRQKVNQERDDEVPEELMRWVWAGGKKLPGLVRRRAAEAQIYET